MNGDTRKHEWNDHPHEPGHSFACPHCGALSLLDGQDPRRRFYLVVVPEGGRAPTYEEPACVAKKPYPGAPQLTPLGKIRDLTRSIPGSSADPGGNGKKAPST